MLYNLLVPLADDYLIFNLFRYLTFRSGGAVMTALFISFVLGPHRYLLAEAPSQKRRPADPGGRAGKPSVDQKGRHAHHGRLPDPDRHYPPPPCFGRT